MRLVVAYITALSSSAQQSLFPHAGVFRIHGILAYVADVLTLDEQNFSLHETMNAPETRR